MSINSSEKIKNNPNSIYFTYESSGGDLILHTVKISYDSSTKNLERVESPGKITTTKDLTSEDEKRFIEELNSIDFYKLDDKYLAEKVPVGAYTYHIFVFIVYTSEIGLAINSIKSVIWQDDSKAPSGLYELSKFIGSL